AVATPEGEILFKGSGESHGWIAEEMRGDKGFGYDPIFVGATTYGKTYAEIDSMRKNLRSHRKDVLDRFQAWLGQDLKQTGGEVCAGIFAKGRGERPRGDARNPGLRTTFVTTDHTKGAAMLRPDRNNHDSSCGRR